MGQLQIAARETRFTSVISPAIDAVLPVAIARAVSIKHELADVGIVRADPARIQQVVWNLLNNAVKFSRAGGEVRVQLRRAHQGIEIQITDTGIGIKPEFLP